MAAFIDVRTPAAASSRAARPELARGAYRARLASGASERAAACRLRFLVFNLELNEGLESAYATGRDEDEFDPVCDHLVVEHAPSGAVVGTYRLQTGESAARHRGYYSEREFRFAPYAPLRPQMVELGRACIHREHRSFEVLTLLWKAVAHYAAAKGARYLVGCSSLTSQDPALGAAMYRRLADWLVEPRLRTTPTPAYGFEADDGGACDLARLQPPKLLRAYLAIGARICGPPAIDREFKTIDFLTLLDMNHLAPSVRARLLSA